MAILSQLCVKKYLFATQSLLVFQVACGASPAAKKFNVCVYADAFLSRPIQLWQFCVHAMQRVDVSCIEGQTSRFTLILR